jgi:hypothetical protein
VGKQHLVSIDAIARHEQPAGQPFLDFPARIGERRVAGLHGEDVSVAQEAPQHGDASRIAGVAAG